MQYDTDNYPSRRRWLLARLVALAAFSGLLSGCASMPPLQAIDRRIELDRFMGDWYVIAAIPIAIPFLSEAEAYNGVESYALNPDGSIAVTYTFRDGGFDGPQRRFTPKGFVHDTKTNAEWRMQFFWPLRSAYLIAWLDADYQRTIIGVPNRRYAWIMARTPQISDTHYAEMTAFLEDTGHDMSKLRRVPQRWPAD